MSFSNTTQQDWQDKVRQELKGTDPQSLYKTQLSNVVLKTLYTEADLPEQPSKASKNTRGWRRGQVVNVPPVDIANKYMLKDLGGGIEEVNLLASTGDSPGVMIRQSVDWNKLFEGVHSNLIRVKIAADDIVSLVEIPEDLARKMHIDWAWDPLSDMARKGQKWAAPQEQSKAHVERCTAVSDTWRPLCINLSDYHLAGATPVHELALMLSTLAEYQRWFSERDLQWLSEQCWVQVPIDANIFENVTKLRAARRLWTGFGRACDRAELSCTLQAVTSERMLTRYDQWVNMLRITTSCCASIWGGADSIVNLPHDLLQDAQTALGGRFARNVHSVLDEECHLGHIADPLAGSYFVENVTEELCQRAWAMFQQIEERGGLQSWICSGELQSALRECATERARWVHTGRLPILGVTTFANPAEDLAPISPSSPLQSGPFPPLWRRRDAAVMEQMRSGRPAKTVFLATIGTEAEWKPRATFATNFFAMMGWPVVVHSGLHSVADIQDLLVAYQQSNAICACICGSNSAYKEHLADVVQAFRQQQIHSILAGNDRDGLADQAIHLGMNVQQVWEALFVALEAQEKSNV